MSKKLFYTSLWRFFNNLHDGFLGGGRLARSYSAADATVVDVGGANSVIPEVVQNERHELRGNSLLHPFMFKDLVDDVSVSARSRYGIINMICADEGDLPMEKHSRKRKAPEVGSVGCGGDEHMNSFVDLELKTHLRKRPKIEID